MLESPGYREQLKEINEYFTKNGETKRMLTAKDVERYLGIHRTTAARRFNITKDGITTVELARRLTNS